MPVWNKVLIHIVGNSLGEGCLAYAGRPSDNDHVLSCSLFERSDGLMKHSIQPVMPQHKTCCEVRASNLCTRFKNSCRNLRLRVSHLKILRDGG